MFEDLGNICAHLCRQASNRLGWADRQIQGCDRFSWCRCRGLMRYLLVFFLLFHTLSAREASSPILSYIEESLPLTGVLKKSGNFVFLDIPDDYIHEILPLIDEGGFEAPPYFTHSHAVGAHITVMYRDEVDQAGVQEIAECGESVHFTLGSCEIVQPIKWKEMKELFLIVVESPELDRIREKYGLPEKEFAYHITVGAKPKIDEDRIMNFGDVSLKKSNIGQFEDGLGVFANRDFAKGEIVVKWNLKILSEEEYLSLPEYERNNFCHKRNGIIYFYPDPERHVNRSNNPNVYADFEKQADLALRDIKAGEELSIPESTVEDF